MHESKPRSFERVRVPRAEDVTDWTAVRSDVTAEAADINQACSVMIAAAGLVFVVAPILHAADILLTASYIVVTLFAGTGIYVAASEAPLSASACRTHTRSGSWWMPRSRATWSSVPARGV